MAARPDVVSSYVLIPGAGGAAGYWAEVVPLLQQAGHEPIAVELPGADESGLAEYADIVVRAAKNATDVVLVAQSLGGFTAPLVCDRLPMRELVFVNAMIPVPGERAGAWWDNVGSSAARLAAADAGGYSREFDLETYFLHDVPPDLAARLAGDEHDESNAVFDSVCDFPAWPDVPVRVLVGTDDRFFPAQFQRRVARERLGMQADLRPGGHLIALSNPRAVADYLLAR